MIKSKKLKILETILRWMAQVVLWKYHPQIIGITGSIGKTSAKEAVFTVLSAKFWARKSEKNYNNEIGIPLTIIGAESGNSSLLKWLKVFFKWIFVILLPLDYPDVVILEMGVDHPGDMDYLLSFIKPNVGIVTNISSSHLEFFKTLENTAKEKGKLIEALPEDGLAILNNDDDLVLGMKERVKAPMSTYGFGEFAGISASNAAPAYKNGIPQGVTFKLSFEGSILPMRLPHIIAPHLVYAALAGVAAGIHFKMNLVDIATALKNFHAPSGRMNLLAGIKNTYLIDDTYNASATSTLSALQVLEDLQANRKIAVLGDMLELGEKSMEGHTRVADKVFAMPADKFLVVGDRMKEAVLKQKPVNYPKENVFFFASPLDAGKTLQNLMQPGDLILVKGSQGMRMEKVVEEVMQEPQKAESLLCRQSVEWSNIPFVKP